MDRGADAWVANTKPPFEQGLRAEGADQRDVHQGGDDPPDTEAAGEERVNLTKQALRRFRYAVDDDHLRAPSTVRPLSYLDLPQRLEPYAHLIHQKLRLFPRRKVPALVELVVMDELGIRPLRPAARRMVDLVRKDAHRNRDGDVLGAKVGLREPLPIKTRRRDCCVRQPEQRGVVEHIVPGKACWLPVKSTCDEPETDRVVVERSEERRVGKECRSR